MIFLFLSLISLANADWCDIVDNKSNQVLTTYAGACNQKQFGGPWGDQSQTHHQVNTTKQASDDAAAAAQASADAARAARIARIKTACLLQSGFLQDLCNEVADGK